PGPLFARFPVTPNPTATIRTVTITAGYRDVTKSATLTVTPPPTAVTSLAVNPAVVIAGTWSRAIATLNGAATYNGPDVGVSFSSSNRSIAFPSADGVQATTGGMTADVGIITAPVAVATPVTIFATYGGVTKSAVPTVMPPPTALADLQVSPSIVVSGALASGTATVSAAAAAGGTVVSLVSSHPAVVAVPANVTVPPGSTTASFAVTTNTVTL